MATETWTEGRLRQGRWWDQLRRYDGVEFNPIPRVSSAFCYGSSRLITSVRGGRTNFMRSVKYRWYKGRMYEVVRYVLRKRQNLRPNPAYWSHRGESSTVDTTSDWIKLNAPSTSYWCRIGGEIASIPMTIPTGNVNEVPASWQKGVDSQLYRKASESTFNAYRQFGELRETVQMLRQPLSSLRRLSEAAWHGIRKGTRGLKGRELTEAVSAAWLEWSFGLSPLIFQTGKICSDLVDALDPHKVKAQKVSAFAGERLDESSTSGIFAVPGRTLSINYEMTNWVEIGCRGGAWVTVSPHQRSRMYTLGVSSAESIVSAAWELVPLSFAVDWFVSVGPLLKECRPPTTCMLSSWRTSYVRRWRRVNLRGIRANYPGAPQYPLFGSMETFCDITSRVVDVRPPGSLLAGPGLFSLSQGLSLAALTAGKISETWKTLPWH